MQDVNQLMQSMEVKPLSRKRKSNTHDDYGKAQKINTTEKAAPNHKEGSMSAKATMTCFNCEQVGHFANRCPDSAIIIHIVNSLQGLSMRRTLPKRENN
jgi:hypothetical protein